MKFLEYSIKKNKSIKVMLIKDEKISQVTVKVLRMDDVGFYYTIGNRKKEHFCEYKNLLGESYARGDEEAKL